MPYQNDIHGNKLTNLLPFPAHERYDKLLETAINVFRLLSFLSCQSVSESIVTGLGTSLPRPHGTRCFTLDCSLIVGTLLTIVSIRLDISNC